MTRGRWVVGVAVIVSLLLAAGFIVHKIRQPVAPSADELCQQFRQNVAAAPTATPGATSAYIIGDSYTSGWTLDNPADGYANALAHELDWDATIDGFPGSGYTNATACGGELIGERTTAIPAGTAVALVQAGLNDSNDPDAVPQRAAEAISSAVQRSATVFVVGPPLAPAKDEDDIREIDDYLRAAAEVSGATYISTIDWDLPYIDDGLHLTVEGHAQFASLVAEAITSG